MHRFSSLVCSFRTRATLTSWILTASCRNYGGIAIYLTHFRHSSPELTVTYLPFSLYTDRWVPTDVPLSLKSTHTCWSRSASSLLFSLSLWSFRCCAGPSWSGNFAGWALRAWSRKVGRPLWRWPGTAIPRMKSSQDFTRCALPIVFRWVHQSCRWVGWPFCIGSWRRGQARQRRWGWTVWNFWWTNVARWLRRQGGKVWSL